MTFSQQVKSDILGAYNGYCGQQGCTNQATSIHHMMPQKKYNIDKYPLFIHSPFNAMPLCQYCHDNLAHIHKVTDELAKLYEDYLVYIKEDVSNYA